MLFCATEMNRREHMDSVAGVFAAEEAYAR
jgi:hypothetical protein